MTDRTDHRAEAERLLADANEWGRQAEEPTPEVGELACLAYAAVHALLAIHDTLTAADRYAANEERQREEAEPDPLDEDDHRDRLTRNGNRLRRWGTKCWHIKRPAGHGSSACGATLDDWDDQDGPLTFAPDAEPDPLNEDDHRDRLTPDGTEWRRTIAGCWHPTIGNVQSRRRCHWNLAYVQSLRGPLAFAPDAQQEATGGDLRASEGESGAEEGGEAEQAVEPLLCPECGLAGDSIDEHNARGCRYVMCDCKLSPSDIARVLIAEAVKPEQAVEQAGGGRG